ncbi:MAG: type II toxin-antitoxin system VapC family toxin [Tepidisphaeraceae bacterium]|jgi:predicted nucleic acid-binding protein
MKWVIDASFVAGLFLPDEMSDKVAVLARDLLKEEAAAPDFLKLELTNILIVASRRKRISASQLKQLSDAFDQLPIVYHGALTAPQRAEILRLAAKHGLSAYDAAYLELAMRLAVPLVSLDKSLIRAAIAEGVEIPRGLH